MWIFNTVKFQILERFLWIIGYRRESQNGSHMKYVYKTFSLIIPRHKEISRWTLNNIFKIIATHQNTTKQAIEKDFLEYYKK